MENVGNFKEQGWLNIWRCLDVAGRWLIGVVFLIAAVPKLIDCESFAGVVGAYGLVPDALVLPVAFSLPVIEIVLAVGLFLGSRICTVGAIVLLWVFILILGYAIWMGLDIDCGCFGPEDPEYTAFSGLRGAIVRDLLMMLPLILSLRFHHKRKLEINFK